MGARYPTGEGRYVYRGRSLASWRIALECGLSKQTVLTIGAASDSRDITEAINAAMRARDERNRLAAQRRHAAQVYGVTPNALAVRRHRKRKSLAAG